MKGVNKINNTVKVDGVALVSNFMARILVEKSDTKINK
jgi:hypothetical protein